MEQLAVQLVLALKLARAGRQMARAKVRTVAFSRANAELRAYNANLSESGAFLKSVLDSSYDCIKVLSLDGRLEFMTAASRCILEVDDFSAIKDAPWADFWSGADRDAALASIEKAKSGALGRFQGHCPTFKGASRWWDVQVSPISDHKDGKPDRLLAISRDITEQKLKDQHLHMLTEELEHRVKNTLAVVQSIATQTYGKTSDQAAHVAFSHRLRALAKAHEVLTKEGWKEASLKDVVAQVVTTHDPTDGNRIIGNGPDLSISAKSSISFTLALHELATNAIKYGALSGSGGTVDVQWRVESDRLRLQWAEHGGPVVVAPSRKGFGSVLIERVLAAELGGDVRIDYHPCGIVCTIEAPLAVLVVTP